MKITTNNTPRIISLTLELSEQEAQVLLGVYGAIGGDPDGPRGMIDQLRKNLIDNKIEGPKRRFSGCIQLPDDWRDI